jgi:hypothetical protein
VGAESSAKREMLNQGGDQAACAKATGEDTAPPYGCGALLRVEVIRLLPARADAPRPSAQPGAPEPSAQADVPALPAAPPTTTSAPSDVPPRSPRELPPFTAYAPPGMQAAPALPLVAPRDHGKSGAIVVGVVLASAVVVGGVIAGVYAVTRAEPAKRGPDGGLGSSPAGWAGRPLLQ